MESQDSNDTSDWFVDRGFLLEPISPIVMSLLGVDSAQIVLLHHGGDCSLRAYHQMRSRVRFVGLMGEEQVPNPRRIIRVYGLANYGLLERLAREIAQTFDDPVQLRVASQSPIYSHLF